MADGASQGIVACPARTLGCLVAGRRYPRVQEIATAWTPIKEPGQREASPLAVLKGPRGWSAPALRLRHLLTPLPRPRTWPNDQPARAQPTRTSQVRSSPRRRLGSSARAEAARCALGVPDDFADFDAVDGDCVARRR